MNIIFLESASNDITWMRKYYKSIFPEGSKQAQKHYLSTLKLLSNSSFIGQLSERIKGAREYHIQRTPFTILYRINDQTIEILKVFDNRSLF